MASPKRNSSNSFERCADTACDGLAGVQGQALVWALACNAPTTTTDIIMARTDVSDLTAVSIAQFLRCSSTLTTVDLHGARSQHAHATPHIDHTTAVGTCAASAALAAQDSATA